MPVLRNTKQREAIRTAIEAAARPLSPQEILELARQGGSQVGIATVYRTIQVLLEEKWLTPVDIPGRPLHYERAGLEHHHHFYCTDCDRVFELEGCPLAARPKTPRGFKVESHQVTLFGTCRTCRH